MHSSNAVQVDSRVLDDIIGSFGASMHVANDLLVCTGAGIAEDNHGEERPPQDGLELIQMDGTCTALESAV